MARYPSKRLVGDGVGISPKIGGWVALFCRRIAPAIIAVALLITQAGFSYANLSQSSPQLDAFGNPLCLTSEEEPQTLGYPCCLTCCLSACMAIIDAPSITYVRLEHPDQTRLPLTRPFQLSKSARYHPGFPRAPPIPDHSNALASHEMTEWN